MDARNKVTNALETSQKVAFRYRDRDRQGKVDTVFSDRVTLELDNDHEGRKFKSFRFDRMQSGVLTLAATA